jgi:glutamine---fructose-6-phosphate transaminase (isomerizing)
MCGIIGYVGPEKASPLILEGLKKLSYRGYDSSGLVVLDKEAVLTKAVGQITELEKKMGDISGGCGIGHNRWATHGEVTEENAHPHTDCQQRIFLVHNGIIENYKILKENLEAEGHVFKSQTDTEVLAHLIEKFFKGNLEEAVEKALTLVEGAYGLAVISLDDPGKIVVARFSSPLVIASTSRGGVVASDPSALLAYSNKMIFLEDGEVAVLTADECWIRGKNKLQETEINWSLEETQKGGYDHFMMKEIMEQPETIFSAIRGRLLDNSVKLGGLDLDRLSRIKKVHIIACGTSFYSGLAGSYMLEEMAGIPATAEVASEFRYRHPIIDSETLFVFISQSGETADTLAALKEVKNRGGLTLGIVNAVGSSVARATDFGIYNHAGPEIGVASTKAFTSQAAILAMLTVVLGRQRRMTEQTAKEIIQELKVLPEKIKEVLARRQEIKEIAQQYINYPNFLFIGRRYGYPLAMEGALKLKEISYIHAEGQPAGEMKHGTIALIDKDFPTFVVAPRSDIQAKLLSNIEEIKSRGGKVVALSTDKMMADNIFIAPNTLEMLTPILYAVPLQLFAYYIGSGKGYDVDKPRNLAKSVTVE